MAPRLAAALALGLTLLAGCGGGSPRHAATPTPTATGAPARPSLAVGITELSPLLVAAPGARDVPGPFARWRDAARRDPSALLPARR